MIFSHRFAKEFHETGYEISIEQYSKFLGNTEKMTNPKKKFFPLLYLSFFQRYL